MRLLPFPLLTTCLSRRSCPPPGFSISPWGDSTVVFSLIPSSLEVTYVSTCECTSLLKDWYCSSLACSTLIGQKRTLGPLELELCGCWNFKPGPLEKQSIFLTIEPALWSLSLALFISQCLVNSPAFNSIPSALLATAIAIYKVSKDRLTLWNAFSFKVDHTELGFHLEFSYSLP